MQTRLETPRILREVRLALVMNGGVSLAVWIGGVTQEIDRLRLAAETNTSRRRGADESTAALYGDLLQILRESARVDIVAGASAGGINGILLSAAIFSAQPLPNLRETWIEIGDFQGLLRTPGEREPPSVLQGDDVVLRELRRRLADAHDPQTPPESQPSYSQYLYVTATDLYGVPVGYRDSTGRRFVEREHRRVFAFHHPESPVTTKQTGSGHPETGAMRPVVDLSDSDSTELLARGARSTSSFPIAFEPHRLPIQVDGKKHDRFVIDGGVLDNQPFNPVLDRIAILPADAPVRRVVAYVVPYVTEPDQPHNGKSDTPDNLDTADNPDTTDNQAQPEPHKAESEELPEPTALLTFQASGDLPRALPKLDSLERVRREARAQQEADADCRRLWEQPETWLQAADSLVGVYRESRWAASHALFSAWTDPHFRRGDGVIGQDPAYDPESVARLHRTPPRPAAAAWLPPEENPFAWRDHMIWRWGLSPAERVGQWALLYLREAVEATNATQEGLLLWNQARTARGYASRLIRFARTLKQELQIEYAQTAGLSIGDRAHAAFGALEEKYKSLSDLQLQFLALDDALAQVTVALDSFPSHANRRVPSVADLLRIEVVRNATSVTDISIPSPFEFLFASAGVRNSLGHRASHPEQKLAGMKLSHFGGFLKRSWRANDWLWGRLDGVEHIMRAIVDLDYLVHLSRMSPNAFAELATFAFTSDEPSAQKELRNLWGKSDDPEQEFADALRDAAAIAADRTRDRTKAVKSLDRCRRALAARVQLTILSEELDRLAETAGEDVEDGTSRTASGFRWAGRLFTRDGRGRRTGVARQLSAGERIELFKAMEIGDEKLKDELGSRRTLALGSQAVAVATAMFAGRHGGLPVVIRGALASARGLTLVASSLVRLLAQSPAAGAAIFALLAALTIWGITSPGSLLGSLLPALALLAVLLGTTIAHLAAGGLERPLHSPSQYVLAVFLAALPLGAAGAIGGGHVLDSHNRDGLWWVGAATLALAALAAFTILVRVGQGGWKPRRWRVTMNIYRFLLLLTLLGAAAYFAVDRWQGETGEGDGTGTCDICAGHDWGGVADERRGILLLTLLLATFLTAALLTEVAVWIRRQARRPRGLAGSGRRSRGRSRQPPRP